MGAQDIKPLAGTTIPTLLARHIVKTAKGNAPLEQDLARVIGEVTLNTQIAGSSILQITVIDPGWAIQRSGFLAVNGDGLLDEIEVNFPEGSAMWWRLTMVAGTTNLNDANLTLTFQDRIVSYLQDKFGAVGVSPGTVTRAQFIKHRVDEVGRGDGHQRIRFVCPSLNVVQPVAGDKHSNGTTQVLDQIAAAHAHTMANKSRGVGNGAAITIKGAKPTGQQTALINQALQIANGLNAGDLATQALMEALIQENGMTNNPGGGGGSTGSLQFIPSTARSLGIDPMNVQQCVTAFLTKSYSAGMQGYQGAIDYAKRKPTAPADQVAQAAQGSAISYYAQWAGEANAIIASSGGVTTGSLGSSASTAGSASGGTGQSDVSQLTRGTPDLPDESSWECMTRLAKDVNWFLFSNGDYLYYMDGPDLAGQKPSLYLKLASDGTQWTVTDPATGQKATDVVTNLRYVVDNTALKYTSTHKRKGQTQRHSRIRRPQTPTQIQFSMVCGVTEWRAGDVFVFQDSGPIDGRWIVLDATRNVLADTFTQFTLGPPTAPLPEPQAQSTGAAAGTPGAPGSPGSAGSVSASGGSAPLGKGGYSALTSATFAGPDQGIDFTGPGPIYALADGVITRVQTSGSGWPGEGAIIVYRMTSGARSGQFVYMAEDLRPTGGMAAGQAFKQGDKLADATGSGRAPGIEVGFAQNAQGQAFGTVHDGKAGGPSPVHGNEMGNFVQQLSGHGASQTAQVAVTQIHKLFGG